MLRSGSVIRLSCFVCTLLGIGVMASSFVKPALVSWYPSLEKSVFTPPDAVFGLVWTVLYALMGVSLWHLCETPGNTPKRFAYSLFAAQLAGNVLWVIAFFHWRIIPVAFWGVLALLPLVGTAAWAFYQHHRRAGYLFVPYLLWLIYAAYLGWFVYRNN